MDWKDALSIVLVVVWLFLLYALGREHGYKEGSNFWHGVADTCMDVMRKSDRQRSELLTMLEEADKRYEKLRAAYERAYAVIEEAGLLDELGDGAL